MSSVKSMNLFRKSRILAVCLLALFLAAAASAESRAADSGTKQQAQSVSGETEKAEEKTAAAEEERKILLTIEDSIKAGLKVTRKTKADYLKAHTGFASKNGKVYYYGEDHKLKTGWIIVNGKRYYAKKKKPYKGSLLTGWQRIKGKEYYFRRTGKKGKYGMAYAGETKDVNGIACKFDKNGVFLGCRHAGSRSGFINRVGEMARDNQRKNNILATVVVAQACLETGYGKYIYHNNLFGLYGKRFGSWQGSIEGYNSYIRTYFPSLIGVRSYSYYVNRIANGGYAAASNYGSSLMSIISSYNLTRFAR